MRAVSCLLFIHHFCYWFAILVCNCSEAPCVWWEADWLGQWIRVSLARASPIPWPWRMPYSILGDKLFWLG